MTDSPRPLSGRAGEPTPDLNRAARWLADEFGMTDESDGHIVYMMTFYDADYWRHLATGVLNSAGAVSRDALLSDDAVMAAQGALDDGPYGDAPGYDNAGEALPFLPSIRVALRAAIGSAAGGHA